jgi:hypothetical protein
MISRKYIPYALVAAVVAGAAIWAGVPPSTVLLVGLLLACPLMMVMHGGHGGGGHGGRGDTEDREGYAGHRQAPGPHWGDR